MSDSAAIIETLLMQTAGLTSKIDGIQDTLKKLVDSGGLDVPCEVNGDVTTFRFPSGRVIHVNPKAPFSERIRIESGDDEQS